MRGAGGVRSVSCRWSFATHLNGHPPDFGLAAGVMGGTDEHLRPGVIAERVSLESRNGQDTAKTELVRVERGLAGSTGRACYVVW